MKLIWLEVLLGFAVPVAWGLRELALLRRDKRLAAEREAQALLARAAAGAAASAPGPASHRPADRDPPDAA